MVGPGQIIFTPDLSKLERVLDNTSSFMNPLAKSFPDDAENDVDENAMTDSTTKQRSVYGLIVVAISRYCRSYY
jgi:hypothetical protein